MTTIFQELSDIGIIPVVQIERAQDAVPLAKALTEGGLPCAEITFRTNAAEESIRRIRQEVPEMLVGAGTVLTLSKLRLPATPERSLSSPGAESESGPLLPGKRGAHDSRLL